MCGQFYIDENGIERVKKRVLHYDEKLYDTAWSKDIHPGERAPVIVGKNNDSFLTVKRWGIQRTNGHGVIFNARQESVWDKVLFQNGIQRYRAVIPAVHFYEWNAAKEKNEFYRTDHSVLYLGGFYDTWGSEEEFVILTTQANESMIRIHDRMPVILEEDEIETWLFDNTASHAILKRKPVLLEHSSYYEQLSLF